MYKADINQVFAADNLYGYLVCDGTPTFGDGTEITLELGIVSEAG
jgi:hypothetical protein